MDFQLTDEQELLLNSLRELITRDFSDEYFRRHDDEYKVPHEFLRALGDNGFTLIGVPEELGGNLAVIGKYAAGFGCVFGHIFPLYFSFKGGKGVVTTAAMVALLDYRVFIPTLITFAVIFAAKRIVSLSSIVAAGCYPIYTLLVKFFFDCESSPLRSHGTDSIQMVAIVTAASVLMAVIVITVHRQNIGRLIRGEEKPISFGKKKADASS